MGALCITTPQPRTLASAQSSPLFNATLKANQQPHYDWPASLAALDEIGYDGWMAMECGLSGPPATVLPRVSRLLRA